MTRKLIASALLMAMLACTTLRPVTDYRSYVATARPSQLWIIPQDGGRLRLEGPRLVHDTLVGFASGRYREFAPGEVRQVQVREPAKGRTAFLIGAAVTVSAVLLVLLASGGPNTDSPNPEGPPTVAPRR